MRWLAVCFIGALVLSLADARDVQTVGGKLQLRESWGTVEVYAVRPNVVRIDTHPNGVRSVPTEMLDPRGLRTAGPTGSVRDGAIAVGNLHVRVDAAEISISDDVTRTSLSFDRAELQSGVVSLKNSDGENLYGMRGNGLFGPRDQRLSVARGLTRNEGAPVAAGSQGDGGAPFVFSTRWGVLIDSVDGRFDSKPGGVRFSGGSRKDIEAYVILGEPKHVIEVVNDLTGHPPMPPKWAIGFMNSQWGTDENMVLGIVDEYRQKRIPLDAFIFDFDFKAWGEDNFGEFRWNSTKGPGNVGPDKYPNGQNGGFGKKMSAKGVHLVGIMKPRILTQTVDLKPTVAAAEATAHNWWMPKKPYQDYFSHRLANDLDFSKPDLRKWYWKHAKDLYETGLSGWWNDEADDGFDSLGFFHMQQSLFEGQTSMSNRRVWSINRNYYLGAQRFGFGTWSGDIRTGFRNMADQRTRMLLLTDLGQTQWSMDSGGFNGHPDNENYARWLEFSAVVPIMRVHSTYGQRRQPWLYGPVAEAAATKAIDWRYRMFPSFYSWQHSANQTGIGIVRPLFWEFPDDPNCANKVDSWMLGDQLLVSPVVEMGQTSKKVYLPAGNWTDCATGKAYQGPETIEIPVDSLLWSDMPMFVRGGSILASQPILQYAGEKPVDEITLEVWPDKARMAKFEVYDDDGETRGYEHGAYFSQMVTGKLESDRLAIAFQDPRGSYATSIKSYRVLVHLPAASTATWNGQSVVATTRHGVLEMETPAGVSGTLVIRLQHPDDGQRTARKSAEGNR